ncbi:glycosyltransferase family 4 protein [Candidatus Omnitrophota bacterium]
MMKILYVIANISFGGGENVFSQIAGRLNSDKYRVKFICLPGGFLEKRLRELEIPLIPVNFRSRFSVKVFLRLIKIMKSEKPDIVHSQGERVNFYARFAAKIARIPAIVSTIAAPVEEFNVNPIKKAVYIISGHYSERLVDRFIAVSESMRAKLINRHKIKADKIVRIYNGVQVDEYKHNQAGFLVRSELNIEGNAPLVGVIGRLVWEKGLPYFIQAAKRVLAYEPTARFLIVGEGPLRNRLKDLVKRLEIEKNIIFTGWRTDIKEIISTLDMLVLSSLREGMPLVVLEAMALAKPVVATDIEGLREVVINGSTGILVTPRNPDSLKDAIIHLLKDKVEASRMGIAGRKLVEDKFSLREMVQQHEQFYDTLVTQKRVKRYDAGGLK